MSDPSLCFDNKKEECTYHMGGSLISVEVLGDGVLALDLGAIFVENHHCWIQIWSLN